MPRAPTKEAPFQPPRPISMSSIASPLRGGEMPTRPPSSLPAQPPSSRWRWRLSIVLAGILGSLVIDLGITTLLSPEWTRLMETFSRAMSGVPAPPLVLAVGILAGLGGFALRSAIRRRVTRRFQRAEEIEAATDLTVLTGLPELPDGDAALHRALRHPSGSFAQALRTLHAGLLATSPPDVPLTVAITSTTPGEGRSTLAAGLGRLLASEGHRVLLIDCDWRHPDQHHLFRVPHDGGLTRLLEKQSHLLDDAIHTDPLSGLDFITTGRGGRLGARMLLSGHMRQTLAACSRCYELVILDLPPVQAAGEVLLLARLADRILFVVRWNHVASSRAMAALTRLRKARGRVAGIVLTRMTTDQPPCDQPRQFGAAQHRATTE